ncbi:transposase [Nonomuraea sp. NPDC049750]|uniref:transposase n=1 Tax=Nonomuraea sp. NPDC049750 TaxID=3154738 RepID=UPI0033D01624
MTRRHRQFSPEFKEAIGMVLAGEWTVASAAHEFGVNASALGNWVSRRHGATRQSMVA